MHFVYTEGPHAHITPKAIRATSNQWLKSSRHFSCHSRQLTGTVQGSLSCIDSFGIQSCMPCQWAHLGRYMHRYAYCYESSHSFIWRERASKCTNTFAHSIHSWVSSISGVMEKILYFYQRLRLLLSTNCNIKNLTIDLSCHSRKSAGVINSIDNDSIPLSARVMSLSHYAWCNSAETGAPK